MSDINQIEKALKKIRTKDPIISTYNASNILDDADNVYSTYSEHAMTHMSLGNTSNYLNHLIKYTTENKNCIIGAIVGSYGHGKTSTAIHLWKECETQQIIGIPPFVWNSLEDIIKGTYGWLRYKLQKCSSDLVKELDELYEYYKENSYEKISVQTKIPIDDLRILHKNGNLKLKLTPEEVLDFISKSTLIAQKAKFKGIIVFTDELQVTLSKYPSQNEFFDDLFAIANSLLNRKGNYGLIVCMPTSTESHIAVVRRDIIDRLKDRQLYLRTDEIYDVNFPRILWEKYSELFEFKKIAYSIVDKETLLSLGQISVRSDLGGGPRNVIDSFIQISNYYIKNNKSYTPINLIDDYLGGKISFDSSTKLVEVVKQEISSSIISSNNKRNVIKLLAAFPNGCPIDIIQKYNLYTDFEEIKILALGEIIQKLANGFTLVKLLEHDIPKESLYVDLIRNFVIHYSERFAENEVVINSFITHVIEKLFKERRKDQIEGWINSSSKDYEDNVVIKTMGTFNKEYPDRTLLIDISLNSQKINQEIEEFGLIINLNTKLDKNLSGELKIINNTILLDLNLCKLYEQELRVPNEDLLPKNKINSLFMLSLLGYIDQNSNYIPSSEKETDLKFFINRLETCINELLFNEQLKNTTHVKLPLAGPQLIIDSFIYLCKEKYPTYKTLKISPRWEDAIENRYIKAINDPSIPLSVARGKRSLEITKDDLSAIFGIKSILTLQSNIESLSDLISCSKWGGRDDKVNISFKLHPLEDLIYKKLNESTVLSNHKKVLNLTDIQALGNEYGYLDDEIKYCLRLLEARRLIDYNDTSIEEVIESSDDYKKKLLEQICTLKDNVNILSILKSFSKDRFINELHTLDDDVTSVIDSEIFEDFNMRLKTVSSELDRIKKGAESELIFELNRNKDAISAIVNTPIPVSLKEDITAKVSWVEDLNMTRITLFNEYNKLISSMRIDLQSISSFLKRFEKELSFIEFKHIYTDVNKYITNYSGHLKEYDTKKLEVKNYEEWGSILKSSSELFSEALNLSEIHNNPEFINKLNLLFKDISSEFDTRKKSVLSDHELFKSKLDQYKKEIDDWSRQKRQNFHELKESYEQKLIEINVPRNKINAVFDLQDPLGSFQKMYSEIYDEVSKYLHEYHIKLNRIESSLLYISKVNCEHVDTELIKVKGLKTELHTLQNNFNVKLIENKDDWNNFIDSINKLNALLVEVETSIKGVRKKKDLTEKESSIMSLLNADYSENDLEEIVLKLVSTNGEKFEFKNLSDDLINLFQKNQIMIKVSMRR